MIIPYIKKKKNKHKILVDIMNNIGSVTITKIHVSKKQKLKVKRQKYDNRRQED